MWTAGTISTAVGATALLAGTSFFALEARQRSEGPSQPAPTAQFLVEEYCMSCHDEDKKRGELSFEAIAAHDIADHPDVWEKVVRKLSTRQMPLALMKFADRVSISHARSWSHGNGRDAPIPDQPACIKSLSPLQCLVGSWWLFYASAAGLCGR